jgi:hypothetical protein
MSHSETDPRSQILHMKKIQAEGLELFIKKNADYGDSYKQHGLIGVLVRLQDKINRAMHVSKHSIHVNESLRDTLIDLHNYAAMAIMESESEPMVPIRTYGSEPPHDIVVPINSFKPIRNESEHVIIIDPIRNGAEPRSSQPYYPNHCINLKD